MANRNTLALKALTQFQAWLVDNGWEVQEPKGEWEVLRAVKQGRKNPLIVYKRLATNSGEQIFHLSVLDRDMRVVRQFLDFKKENFMPNQKQLQEIFDYLHDYLNNAATCIDLVGGNKVHIDIDCFGEFDLIIDPESVHLMENANHD